MFLKFHSFIVEIASPSKEILDRLAKDFSSFSLQEETSSCPDLALSLEEGRDFLDWPCTLVWKSGPFYRYADEKGKRYLNYGNRLWGIVDFEKERASFRAEDVHLLHEIAYLYLLSRLGKMMETRGLFKIHASALEDRGTIHLFPMLMKGGKTTLFLSLLSQAPLKILADDAPLVDLEGEIYPFPIRVGMERLESFPCFRAEGIYLLKRRRFGLKYLVDIADFKNAVARKTQGAALCLYKTRRIEKDHFSCKSVSRLALFPLVFWNLVLGLGLPYAREFYLEGSPKDFFVLVRTGGARLWAAFRLLSRAQCFELVLGNNPTLNASRLLDLWGHDRREYDEGREEASDFT